MKGGRRVESYQHSLLARCALHRLERQYADVIRRLHHQQAVPHVS